MKIQLSVLTILFLFLVGPNFCHTCTVFCLENADNLIVGRNYDWNFGGGMLVINKKDQVKTAFAYSGEGKSTNNLARWTSKYGSITFGYGREIAFSGINEAGLTVDVLWLDQTQYSGNDSRPSVSVDQFAQFILDNYKNVDEIAKSDKLIRIRPSITGITKVHFFAVDSSGSSLAIEFLNGKTVFHCKNTMPVKVMANDAYEQSLLHLKKWLSGKLMGGDGGMGMKNYVPSLTRFDTAASMVSNCQNANTADIVKYAFTVLDSVQQGDHTKFKIVFDIKNRTIYFKSLQNPKLRYFRFDSFDFSNRSNSKMLDLNSNLEGDVTSKFMEYSTITNESLFNAALEDLGYTNIVLLHQFSQYLDTLSCSEK